MRIRNLALSILVVSGLIPDAGADSLPTLELRRQSAPRLDGIWGRGEWIGGSSAILSKKGRPEKPEVQVIETASGLYIGVLMRDSTPVFGRSGKGESLHREDVFEIFFETGGDVRRYAELQVSRAGSVFYKSYVLRAEPEVTKTGRLTPEFTERFLTESIEPAPRGVRCASGSGEGYWVAEVFLPRQLYGPVARANFAIHDWDRPLGDHVRTGHFYYWSTIESGCPHISPSRFGSLISRS